MGPVSTPPVDAEHADSTLADLRESPPRAAGRWFRRLGVLTLALILAAAALDLLGPREADVTVHQGGYHLTVSYPQVTRAGQPAPLHLLVESDLGFGQTVQLRLCDELFDDLDFQSWYPTPAAETATPPWIIYEFDPPPTGDRLEISLDARAAPGQLGGTDDCEVAVMEADTPVASTSFTVWRMP